MGMTSYTSQGGEGSSPGSSTPSTPSHAQWLRRQFSGGGPSSCASLYYPGLCHTCDTGGEGVARRDSESLEAPWPDLLVDRRTLQERRQGREGRSDEYLYLQIFIFVYSGTPGPWRGASLWPSSSWWSSQWLTPA